MNKTQNIITILLIFFHSLFCIAQNLDNQIIHIAEKTDGVRVNGFLTESGDTIIPVKSHWLIEAYDGEPLIILYDSIGTKVYNTFGDVVFQTDSLIYFWNSGLDSVLYTFIDDFWRLFNINHKHLLKPKFKGISQFQENEALVLTENDSIFSISPEGILLNKKRLWPNPIDIDSLEEANFSNSYSSKVFPSENHIHLNDYLIDEFSIPRDYWKKKSYYIRFGKCDYGDSQKRFLAYFELKNGWILNIEIGHEWVKFTLRINRVSFYDSVAFVMSMLKHRVQRFKYEGDVFEIHAEDEAAGKEYKITDCGNGVVEIVYEEST